MSRFHRLPLCARSVPRFHTGFRNGRRTLALTAALLFAGAAFASAQDTRATREFRELADHVPSWARPENSIGAVPPDQKLTGLTIVLARSAAKQAAFDKFLAEQQDSASPNYQKWLTPREVGERYGVADSELQALTDWLKSQNLHVDWVAPGKNFVGISGTAGDVGLAFQTDINYYDAGASPKISVASAPLVPTELAPMVQAIRGLYSIEDRPLSHVQPVHSARPAMSVDGFNFVTPADFNTIYDVPSSVTGKGYTIGIVGRSRTDFADFSAFRKLTKTTFPNPTEVVPTKFGGVDPGPAYTAPPTDGADIGDQVEATLDVFRAGSVANGAKLLLVVTTSAGGDIGADAEYLVQTEPLPAQVMNLSFGLCESEAGSAGVKYWDSIFAQAQAEGISVFVASGDSGASGCDAYFSTPPSSPAPNSPNYICSSSHATCVGGTEFNDIDQSKYWSSSNKSNLGSALSYIPEGGWNEPLNGGETQAAASGGGVSKFIKTPSWQTGKGVPSARSGRYMPDLAFTAAGHDGYFGCLAAGGSSCVPNSSGEYYFSYFYGTSAAAPGMAGITVLLDQKLGNKQGNLNAELYTMASKSASAFHDVTVSSSGVKSCSVKTPSMCNNSIPSPTKLTGGQPGFLVGTGFDEVTGLGSLNVSKFLSDYK